MSESQIKELINKIVLEVIRKMNGFGDYSVLALVTRYSAYAAEAANYLSEKSAYAALFDDVEPLEDMPSKRIESVQDKKVLTRTLRDIKEIVLVTPSLSLITAIAEGDDTDFVAEVFQKSLLDGKKATVLLDFKQPKFKRGTLFEKVLGAINAMRDMGADIIYLGAGQSTGHTLVTEYEVNEAARQGIKQLQCAPGAIITPLARDAAKEKGIAIDI